MMAELFLIVGTIAFVMILCWPAILLGRQGYTIVGLCKISGLLEEEKENQDMGILNQSDEVTGLKKELGKLRSKLVKAGLAAWRPRAKDGSMKLVFKNKVKSKYDKTELVEELDSLKL
jgi:hypothetical protein